MKKYLFFTILLAGTTAMLTGSFALLAQVPQSFKYQAVARDAAGMVMANQELNFEISILKSDPGGEVVYSEQHTDTTNQFGLVALDIGSGNVITGDFSSIAWGDDTYFLMVEMDGGYMGATQLLSVPYALHAQTVAVDKVDDADADPLNEIQTLSLSGTLLTLSNEGGTVTFPSSGGGDNWGTQTVVTDATLSGNGTTATPLKIAPQGATTGQALKWNGTTWAPADDATGDGGLTLPYSGTTGEGTYGINIEHTATSGANFGGKFKSASTNGVGVYGLASANNGNAWGLHGESNSITGAGVFGHSLAGSGESFGVVGTSESGEGAGVLGTNYSSNGTAICGIKGKVSSSSGYSGHFTGGRFYVDGKVGIGTDSPAALLHSKGTGTGQGNVLFEGEFKESNPGDPPASGYGTRMMWYPDKAAFRVGVVVGNRWDKENIGYYSTAMGANTKASGYSSTVMGYHAQALGDESTAMGNNTKASGTNSTAMGHYAQALGDESTVIGNNTKASGTNSTAMGHYAQALGDESTAMGYNTKASGTNSTALGYYTTAPSAYETVIGRLNTKYEPADSMSWDARDRLFVIGNGKGMDLESNAMTVLKNGNVGIGPDNPVYKLDLLGELNIQSEDSGDKAIFVNSTEALWYDGTYFSWGYGADYNYFARKVTIGTTDDPGTHLLVVNGTAAKPGGGSWASWSDLRLKEIHENYAKGLEEIAALSPVTFSYKEDNPLMLPDDQEYVGLVAQDVQEIFPEAVSEGKDGYLQLDMQPVNVALINAVRELKAENNRLSDANQQLRSENSQIIKRLEKLEVLVLEEAYAANPINAVVNQKRYNKGTKIDY